MRSSILSPALLFATSVAASVLPSLTQLNTPVPNPQPTICSDIVNANLNDSSVWFYASDAVACLTSVPFNAAVATKFIKYYNQTLEFQSTSAFLKNPPPSYQQPSVDIVATLNDIQDRIDSGYYQNQYVFEADVQRLSLATHDGHTILYAGILNQFQFSAPFYIQALSVDGKQAPEVWIYDDVATYAANNSAASPIDKINGISVIEYLEQYAAEQSFGMLEPDADWNQLTLSPAQQIVGGSNVFSGLATFYPGDDMNVTHKDGTETTWYWLALYNSPGFTGPLETGGDFYNFFVLSNYPANYDETSEAYYNLTANNSANGSSDDSSSDSSNDSASSTMTSWNSVSTAYPPNTISYQDQLGLGSTGFVTGYFLPNISTAVISIPSFNEYSDGIGSFSEAIVDFINNSTERNAKNIIIDLQQNSGGQVSLAFDTFRLFFPGTVPYSGSRMRSHDLANILGETFTDAFQPLTTSSDGYYDLLGEEWVITDQVNAQTGQNFSSWAEYYGPLNENGGTFSLTQRYNLSSELFDNAFLNIDFPPCYYDGTCDTGSDWNPEDIIILTDGTCASACALFVEMLTQDAGVKHSVVVGGRPHNGSMQLVSGSRGAAFYTSGQIDSGFIDADSFSPDASNTYVDDTGMYINQAGLNLRDQMRPNQTVPNQFLYLPAECRIYWTMANINDYTNLWYDTWNGIFGDTSICVPGSRNATAPATKSPSLKRSTDNVASWPVSSYIIQGLVSSTEPETESLDTGLLDAVGVSSKQAPVFCGTDDGLPDHRRCPQSLECRPYRLPCQPTGVKSHYCAAFTSYCKANGDGQTCAFYESCIQNPPSNSRGNNVANFGNDPKSLSNRVSSTSGYCFPVASKASRRECRVILGLQESALNRLIESE